MHAKIYSLTRGRMDTPANAAKNSLAVGTVLQMEGYSNPKFAVIENQGILAGYESQGARYKVVDLEKKTIRIKCSYELMYLSEKKDSRIQTYITSQVLSADEVLDLRAQAEGLARDVQTRQAQAKAEADQLEAAGRAIAAQLIPAGAQALIVAVEEIDDCEIQTDYFNVRHGETVILGYSMHKRDLFNEMRKVADRIPETAHLKTAPAVNDNGQARTEENKSYWTPADEHREKYSMGAGYYLKAGGCYATAWKIEKVHKYGDGWDSKYYRSLAKRNVLEGGK